MKKVVVERTTRIFDDFFKIDEAIVRYEKFSGEMSNPVRRLNFERGDSVAALVQNTSTKELIFVNQFKYPTYAKGPGWITETVAGMIDRGESAEAAIRREMVEEMGYRAEKVEHISTFYVSPGGTSERIILFYVEIEDAGKIAHGGGIAAENEDIQTIGLNLEQALAQIASGEIVDAKTILAIYWLQNRKL